MSYSSRLDSPSIERRYAIGFVGFSCSRLGVYAFLRISVLRPCRLRPRRRHHRSSASHKAERIRFSGIDCPEKGQAYGKRVKQAASALAFGKQVTLQRHGKDKYGQTLADVLLADGTNVNHELVKEGWCWWCRKYAPGDTELEQLEQSAREAKRGLWVDPAPIPPWVYRKARRGQALDRSDLVPLGAETQGNPSTHGPPAISPLLGAIKQGSPFPTSTSPYPIIGNRKSHIYHRPTCPNYSQIAPKNQKAFNSPAEAEESGYRVAGNCP